MRRRWTILVAAVSLLLGFGSAQAQGEAPQAGAKEPAAAASPAPEEAPTAHDPSDDIVAHVAAMTAIVKEHRDAPDEVKNMLKAYITQNGAAMKASGDAFEAHLSTLSVEQATAFKERLQRKMEKALSEYLEVMLDFAHRHPDAAKELDEMLQAVE